MHHVTCHARESQTNCHAQYAGWLPTMGYRICRVFFSAKTRQRIVICRDRDEFFQTSLSPGYPQYVLPTAWGGTILASQDILTELVLQKLEERYKLMDEFKLEPEEEEEEEEEHSSSDEKENPDEEAQFLQSQRDRVATLKQREIARRSEKSVSQAAMAETVLETQWSEWKKRLDTLEQQQNARGTLPTSEHERRMLKLSFNELQEILNSQRRQVSLNDALSDASLLRWHKVLVAGQGQLDKLQVKLLPKNKFVFRRYRQAMAEREQARNDGDCNEKDEHNGSESSPEQSNSQSNNNDDDSLANSLQDLSNETIEIFENGITARQSDTQICRDINFVHGSIPLVWRRLEKCAITWQCPENTDSMTGSSVLHLVNLIDCQLNIDMYLSSIHVTDCNNITLRVSRVQQVRLHTSKNVQVWGQVTGGTILEDCQKIGVTANCPNVQDFSWLKAGRPSPNLERLTENPDQESSAPLSKEPAIPQTTTKTAEPAPPRAGPATSEESDDEL